MTTVTQVQAMPVLNPANGFIAKAGFDYTLNPYSGCSFACSYCYARFFAPSQVEQDTWGDWVKVKADNTTAITRILSRHPNAAIYISTATDPYQGVEKQAELTKHCLKAMLPYQPRITIQTRSPLVTRDIDLLSQFSKLRVNMTIGTDSDEVRQAYEPSAPSIKARFKALALLTNAGIAVGLSISPMLPVLDANRFARLIETIEPSEVVTIRMKNAARGTMSAQSPLNFVQHLDDDGWGEREYRAVRDVLTNVLAPLPVLENEGGFRPPV